MQPSEVRKITKWETSDGKEHYSIEAAQRHALQIVRTDSANAVLTSGGSVADALRAMGWTGTIDPVLEKVTGATKLVISYWQCRDTPGYQVREFRPNGSLWVWGDAGSWSGSYGNEVTIYDLVRYAEDERTIFA